jgi:hypothetical protein
METIASSRFRDQALILMDPDRGVRSAPFRTEVGQMPLEEIRNGCARASEALLKLKEGL